MTRVDQQPSAGAQISGAVLGNEAGIERDKQTNGPVGQIEFGPVIGRDEAPFCLAGVAAMPANYLVYACRVGEEATGLTVVVDIGDRIENERHCNVDKRARIQNRRGSGEVADSREEPQSITRVTVLFFPKTSSQLVHRVQDATCQPHAIVPICAGDRKVDGGGLWSGPSRPRPTIRSPGVQSTVSKSATLLFMPAITRFITAEASRKSIEQIRRLFFAAFDETFTEQDWEHVLGGWHVVVQDGGVVIAHAAVVQRVLEVGGQPFRTGYVEGVATDPSRQNQGLGTRTMEEVSRLLRSEFEMGALATSVHGFYERLGWKRWQGPTYVRHGPELLRTEEQDSDVMALLFGPSKGIDPTASISCPNRVGDDW